MATWEELMDFSWIGGEETKESRQQWTVRAHMTHRKETMDIRSASARSPQPSKVKGNLNMKDKISQVDQLSHARTLQIAREIQQIEKLTEKEKNLPLYPVWKSSEPISPCEEACETEGPCPDDISTSNCSPSSKNQLDANQVQLRRWVPCKSLLDDEITVQTSFEPSIELPVVPEQSSPDIAPQVTYEMESSNNSNREHSRGTDHDLSPLIVPLEPVDEVGHVPDDTSDMQTTFETSIELPITSPQSITSPCVPEENYDTGEEQTTFETSMEVDEDEALRQFEAMLERQPACSVAQSSQDSSSSTTPVWKAVRDPKTGRIYYYNRETRETSWLPPTKVLVTKNCDGPTTPSRSLSTPTVPVSPESLASVEPSPRQSPLQPQHEIKIESEPEAETEIVRVSTPPQSSPIMLGVLHAIEHAQVQQPRISSSTASFPKKKPMWKEVIDQSTGKKYYYHRKTGETTWAPPQNEDIVPAPAPPPNPIDICADLIQEEERLRASKGSTTPTKASATVEEGKENAEREDDDRTGLLLNPR
eukprot:Nitzschia sp. Nitz4//NODE_159_length_47236_cov_74.723851//33012//34610//NITZ4_additional_000012-RA//1//CDS//3329531755//8917//frame0